MLQLRRTIHYESEAWLGGTNNDRDPEDLMVSPRAFVQFKSMRLDQTGRSN